MSHAVEVREIVPQRNANGDGSGSDVSNEQVVRNPTPEDEDDVEESQPSNAGAVSPAKPARRPWHWALIAAAAVAAAGGGIAYYVHSLSFESTDDAFIDGHIVPVSSRVSGHVANVYVTDNQKVQEGDLLVALDPADFETRQAAAKAALQTAQATCKARATGVAAAKADLQQTNADLLAAEARQQRAKAHAQRIQSLVPDHAASQDSLEEAMAAARVARADVTAMREKVSAKQAAIEEAKSADAAAESSVRQAQAELEQAKLNRSYTKVYAPISGHVTRKSVEAGEYVQVGQPLLALVDPNVWVIANFKETQLAKMRPGQPVVVTVDTHPGVEFAAHVDSIQRGSGARFSLLPPENATGNYVKVVQRVPVKIVFDDPRQLRQYVLGPGMSVVPTVDIRVSSAAAASTVRQASQSR